MLFRLISSGSDSRSTSSWTKTTTQFTSSTETHTTFSDTIVQTRIRLVADIRDLDDISIEQMTIDGFLELLERERLMHMPHRGSAWDGVLKSAEFLAIQVSSFAQATVSFLSDSHTASKLILAACYSLIKVSPPTYHPILLTMSAWTSKCRYTKIHLWHSVRARPLSVLLFAPQQTPLHQRAC